VVTRFDEFVDTVGVPGLFAFVIIPGLPDDAICFLSGLTKWKLPTFIAVISVGRLPAYVFTVYAAGGRIADGRFLSGLAIILLIVLASVVGYYKQETVRDLVARMSRDSLLIARRVMAAPDGSSPRPLSVEDEAVEPAEEDGYRVGDEVHDLSPLHERVEDAELDRDRRPADQVGLE